MVVSLADEKAALTDVNLVVVLVGEMGATWVVCSADCLVVWMALWLVVSKDVKMVEPMEKSMAAWLVDEMVCAMVERKAVLMAVKMDDSMVENLDIELVDARVDLMVVSLADGKDVLTAETSVATMVVHSVVHSAGCWVALMDAMRVDQMDGSMAACLAVRSAVCLDVWMDVMWVA